MGKYIEEYKNKILKAQLGVKLPEMPVQTEFGNLHVNSTFTPNRFNLAKLGIEGKFKVPFKLGLHTFPILDLGGGLLDIFKEYNEIKNSPNPELKKQELENLNEMRRTKLFGDKPGKFKFNPEMLKKGGGLSRDKDYGSEKKPYPSVKSGDFAGGGRSYPIPTKADAVDALRLAGLHGRADVKAKVYAKYPELKKKK